MLATSRKAKRARVAEYLRDPLTAPNSNAAIARLFDVTAAFVASVREKVEAEGQAFQKGTLQRIRLDAIRRDGGTQPRAATDQEAVREYAADMKAGAEFPPLSVVFDGENYWLWDGFHRWHAWNRLGVEEVLAEVRMGTQRDATLLAVSANYDHGKRRTNDDKRRVVEYLLRDPEWSHRSDNWIAQTCHVSCPLVGKIRSELGIDFKNLKSGADGRTIDTSNIGRKPTAADDDADDLAAAEAALAEPGSVPWEQVKQDLGIDPGPLVRPEVIAPVAKCDLRLTGNVDDDVDRFGRTYPDGSKRRFLTLALASLDAEEPNEPDAEPVKLGAAALAILDALRQGPKTGAELTRYGLRYSARVAELRSAGHQIATERGEGGSYLFRLV